MLADGGSGITKAVCHAGDEMMDKYGTDQADGLRRLFHSSPPEVLALVPCGAVTTRWVADQLRVRARCGVQMLVLDEWQACGNLADCLGVSTRFDLLQVVAGQVTEADAVVDVIPGLRVVQVGQLAQELGCERITKQRALTHLEHLQADCDEWLLMAQAHALAGPSPLVLAAPRTALVVDAHPMSVTTAWTTLRRLREQAPTMSFVLCQAGEASAPLHQALQQFCQLAQVRMGVHIELATSLGEALVLGEGDVSGFADAFIQRLVRASRTPGFSGSPRPARMSLP